MKLLNLVVIFFIYAAFLCFGEEFKVTPSLSIKEDNVNLDVLFQIKDKHYLYKDQIKISIISPDDAKLLSKNEQESVLKFDKYFGKEILVFDKNFTMSFQIQNYDPKQDINLKVKFQGCNNELCFLPQTKSFILNNETRIVDFNIKENIIKNNEDLIGELKNKLEKFTVKGKIVGYKNSDEFILSLKNILEENNETGTDDFSEKNIFITIILIILGGLALNLTPCVLPMIPINIAIIGAGSKAETKIKGFILGGFYALGISLVYGLVGAFVIVTGSTFGSLNSSYVFNFVIGLIFVILALALLDVIVIDFSKFQSKASLKKEKGSYFLAFFMGGVSALLAGACVAPVVIAVLLYSAKLYASGKYLALFLPCFLGIGMGIPWPFAGASLSFLPKPGHWMIVVKKVFAILIFLFAVYYFNLGYNLKRNLSDLSSDDIKRDHEYIDQDSFMKLNNILSESIKHGKPVLIDFWASWCKNCVAMDHTTLKDAKVKKKLKDILFVKFKAEKPNEKNTKKILDLFGVLGLPTFVVLEKK